MYQLIMLIHVFAAVAIIALVLLQQGKGATVGAAFGSGASQTVFGSRGSGSFLFRLTLGFVAVFFVTSIVLNYLVMHTYKQQKNIILPFVPANKSAAPATSNDIVPPAAPTLPTNAAPTELNKQLEKMDIPAVPAAPAEKKI